MDLLVLHPRRASARRLAKALDCREATLYPEFQPDLLVRFGHREGPEGRVLTINPREALEKLPRPVLARLFRLHRLPYNTAKTGTREVTVHIVDARVVGLRTNHSFTIAEKQKALGTAIRALYLIGLDFGVVKVKVPYQGNPQVAWVRAAPVLNSLLAKGYAREINALIGRYLTTPVQPARPELNIAENNDILLGADPEFMLKSTNGKLVPAYTFFPQKGMVGCDQLRAIGELRPAPRTCPQALTESIRHLLIRAAKRIRRKSIRMVAGSWPFRRFPIGGHIHFGRLPLTFQLIRALDNYLLIPLFLVERKATSLKRRRYYGCLGDVRPKGPGRFEYRAPGSWLVSPDITLAALSLAKVVAKNAPYLHRNLFADPQATQAFYQGNKAFFRPLLPELQKELATLPGYKEIAAGLTPLWQMIERGDEWDEKTDLRQAWLIG